MSVGDGKQQEARSCTNPECPIGCPESHSKWDAQCTCSSLYEYATGRCPKHGDDLPARQATQPSQVSGEPGPNSATWQDAAMKSLDKVIELEAQLKSEFQRGQQAMAEKAAQHIGSYYSIEKQGWVCAGCGFSYGDYLTSQEQRRKLVAEHIRSLAGAEPRKWECTCTTDKTNCMVHAPDPAGAYASVEPPQDKLRQLVAKWRELRWTPAASEAFRLCADDLEAILSLGASNDKSTTEASSADGH